MSVTVTQQVLQVSSEWLASKGMVQAPEVQLPHGNTRACWQKRCGASTVSASRPKAMLSWGCCPSLCKSEFTPRVGVYAGTAQSRWLIV
eukprot:2186114-Pyramimonas_sp.AAC.1